MPSTSNYCELHEKVIAREGAAERLAARRGRDETLKEIGLGELRRAVGRRSQADIEFGCGECSVVRAHVVRREP